MMDKSSKESRISSSKESLNNLIQKVHVTEGKELNRVLGKLSWVGNPENEKKFLEKLYQKPLYEILAIGMTPEE